MNLKKTHLDRRFEFQFPDVDTHLLVEDSEEGVVIRASRDSFTDRRKQNFIRELAAEGFIADCFQRSCRSVRWMVDASLAKPREDVTTRTNRFMFRLWRRAVWLWLALMAVAVMHGHPSP